MGICSKYCFVVSLTTNKSFLLPLAPSAIADQRYELRILIKKGPPQSLIMARIGFTDLTDRRMPGLTNQN